MRPEFIHEDSDSLLQSPIADFSYDIVIRKIGDPVQLGFVGPRENWIDDQIQRYFQVIDGPSIWQYTDESRQYITLASRASLPAGASIDYWIRGAGRVMGLALRYDVAMGVPFAPSFMKLLRLLHDPTLDIEAHLSEEDPRFLQSVKWIREINWTKELPATVTWTTFDELKPNGDSISLSKDNWEEYLALRMEKKLVWDNHESMQIFKAGVFDVVGHGIFGLLTEEELEARLRPSPNGLTSEKLWNGIQWRKFQPGNFKV